MRLLSMEAVTSVLDGDFEGISRGWVLDGAGPARYGYYFQHPCKQEWLGRSCREVVELAKNTRKFHSRA